MSLLRFTQPLIAVDELEDGLRGEGVMHFGAVDRDAGDALGLLEEDLFVFDDGLPGDGGISHWGTPVRGIEGRDQDREEQGT